MGQTFSTSGCARMAVAILKAGAACGCPAAAAGAGGCAEEEDGAVSPRRFLRPVSRSLARRANRAEIHSLTVETKTLTRKNMKDNPAITSRTCELNMRGLLTLAVGETEGEWEVRRAGKRCQRGVESDSGAREFVRRGGGLGRGRQGY